MPDFLLTAMWAEYLHVTRRYLTEKARRPGSVNEATVAHNIVFPTLQRIGWAATDFDEIRMEKHLASGFIDYSLMQGEAVRVAVECKNLAQSLNSQKAIEQTVTYGFLVNAPYSILTNGQRWTIYETFARKMPRDKRLRTVDLLKANDEDVNEFFAQFCRQRVYDSRQFIIRPSDPRPTRSSSAKKAGPENTVRIVAAEEGNKKRRRKKNGRRGHQRASLNSEHFKMVLPTMRKKFGDIRPFVEPETGREGRFRNKFVVNQKTTLQICLASGKNAVGTFSIRASYLECDEILLCMSDCPHVWLLDKHELSAIVTKIGPNRATWSFRVTQIANDPAKLVLTAEDGKILLVEEFGRALPLAA